MFILSIEQVSKAITSDEDLINLIFKCISNVVNYLNKEEQFDLLIMSMSILLNIFDSNSASNNPEPVTLSRQIPTYEIIVEVRYFLLYY